MKIANAEYNQIIDYLNLFLQIEEQKMVLNRLKDQLNDKAQALRTVLPIEDHCFINEEGLGQFTVYLKSSDDWTISTEDIEIVELTALNCLDT